MKLQPIDHQIVEKIQDAIMNNPPVVPVSDNGVPSEWQKILIAGPFRSGITTFLRQATEPITSPTGEVLNIGLGFGRIAIDESLVLYFFETPEPRHHSSDWKILAEGALGVIVMADSRAKNTFHQAVSILDFFQKVTLTTYVIAANFQDQPDALPIPALKDVVPDDIPVIPCIATDKESVKRVVLALLEKVREATEEP